jgi:hypothetical protein
MRKTNADKTYYYDAQVDANVYFDSGKGKPERLRAVVTLLMLLLSQGRHRVLTQPFRQGVSSYRVSPNSQFHNYRGLTRMYSSMHMHILIFASLRKRVMIHSRPVIKDKEVELANQTLHDLSRLVNQPTSLLHCIPTSERGSSDQCTDYDIREYPVYKAANRMMKGAKGGIWDLVIETRSQTQKQDQSSEDSEEDSNDDDVFNGNRPTNPRENRKDTQTRSNKDGETKGSQFQSPDRDRR